MPAEIVEISVGSPDAVPVISGATIGSDCAYLQYTSGSTTLPRGVKITHDNLGANIAAIVRRFDVKEDDVYCHWLPLYHDMGLVTSLTGLAMGCTAYLMKPDHFAQNPMGWLRAIERFGATFTGAPNSALELCASRQARRPERVNLSQLRTLFCGAEPVHGATLHRFANAFSSAGLRDDVFAPCYGLAEATLLVAGGRIRVGKEMTSVSCGSPAQGTEVSIVNAATGECVPPGQIGEIWVRGPSVSPGYANTCDDDGIFQATRADGSGPYLRTKDLGRIVDGDLYVVGRMRDMVIIEGRNVHLCDVDASLRLGNPAVAGRPGVALSTENGLAVVQEVHGSEHALPDLAQALAAAVASDHAVTPTSIHLVRPGTIPLTTSGKVLRAECADLVTGGTSKVLYIWRPSNAKPDASSLEVRIEQILLTALGTAPTTLDRELHFTELGLSSSRATELVYQLSEETGIPLDTGVLFDHGTIAGLATYLHDQGASRPSLSLRVSAGADYTREARAPLVRGLVAMALDVIYTRAAGDMLFREDGTAVLDLVGGFGTTLFGHNRPEITRAMQQALAAEVPIHAQGSIRTAPGRLAAALSRRLEESLSRRFETSLWSTGAEAVEAAMAHTRFAYDQRARAWLTAATRRAESICRGKPADAPIPDHLMYGLPQEEEKVQVTWGRFASFLGAHNRRLLSTPARFAALARAFHGKTSGAHGLTDTVQEQLFGAAQPACDRFHQEDTSTLARLLKERSVALLELSEEGNVELREQPWACVLGVFIEPIQSEGGVHPISPNVAQEIRCLTAAVGVPLIADEIQCGFGRCGAFTVSAEIGLDPDYVLLGKSLGGGVAKLASVSAPLTGKDERFGMRQSSTFADDEHSAQVGLAALDLYDREDVPGRAARLGETLLNMLGAVRDRYPAAIREVRGRGCLIGIELDLPVEGVDWASRDLGAIAAGFLLSRHAIRVLPTLSAPRVLRVEPSAFLTPEAVERVRSAFTDLAAALCDTRSARLIGHLAGVADEHLSTLEPKRAVPAAPVGEISSCELKTSRVAFLSYLIGSGELASVDPRFQRLSEETADRLLDRIHRHIGPKVVRRTIVQSDRRATTELLTIGIPATSSQIAAALRHGETDWIRARVREGVDLALSEGCRIAGLAGYLSILTDNGMDVLSPKIGVTTGNSLTVASLISNLEAAASAQGIDLSEVRLAILGAGGNIASMAAEILAPRVGRLDLIGREAGAPRLVAAAERLRTVGGVVEASGMERLQHADIVITATSSPVAVIGAAEIGSCTRIICDVAVPPDVDQQLTVQRPDVTVVRGGTVRVPNSAGTDFTFGHLPPSRAYACMSETVILGLDRHIGNFSIGALRRTDVEHILARATHHGFMTSSE